MLRFVRTFLCAICASLVIAMASDTSDRENLLAALSAFPDVSSVLNEEQVDFLIEKGYTDSRTLQLLESQDMPNPPFKPAVRKALLRTFGPAGQRPFLVLRGLHHHWWQLLCCRTGLQGCYNVKRLTNKDRTEHAVCQAR